jgi:hypothetical protein
METLRKMLQSAFIAAILFAPMSQSIAGVAVGISINVAPPELPVYDQPVCPGPDYIWTPGYWAYGDEGYYWVPGIWVLAPQPGFLWTPGYWGWSDGYYVWHDGYWGRHVGFYGGVCYGFGYTGVGFYGGYWRHGVYNYNRSVNNVNVSVVHNVYSRTVVTPAVTARVSFNGGAGGTLAKPTAKEIVAVHERHIPVTVQQIQHHQTAVKNRELLSSVNHGRPSAEVLAKHAASSPHPEAARVNNFGPHDHAAHGPHMDYSRPEQEQRDHHGRHER